MRSWNLLKYECCENLENRDAAPSSHRPNCVRRYETFHKDFNAFFLLFQMKWLWQILWKMRHSAAGTILCKTFLRFPQTRWQRTGSHGFQEKNQKTLNMILAILCNLQSGRRLLGFNTVWEFVEGHFNWVDWIFATGCLFLFNYCKERKKHVFSTKNGLINVGLMPIK